jgi:acyl-CoA dehydrogenase
MIDLTFDAGAQNRLDMLQWLGKEYLRPLGIEADQLDRAIPADHPFFQKVVEMGLGARGPGGGGGDRREGPSKRARLGVLLGEEASYWDRGAAVALPGPGLGASTIQAMGTDEQKERFMAPFKGKDRPRWGAFAMTEPHAGSDVAQIRTRAVKDGDHYVLNGAKTFISNAKRAEWIVVFATIDPSLGREGHRAFVIERGTPGIEHMRVEHKMGLRAYETCSFVIENCRVPAENLLGGEEHDQARQGFKGAMKSFDATRPIVAVMAVGIARAAWDHTRDLVREHYMDGRAIARHRRIRTRLARMRQKIDHARLLCWRAASLADHHQPNTLEASLAKGFAPPAALQAVELGLEVAGDAGLAADDYLDKLCRDVKVLDIVEGTQQIQRIVIARRLVGYPSLRAQTQ